MFYSKELLNRRTPLGVAWYAAHNSKSGKLKLNRGAIMQVNIGETWCAPRERKAPCLASLRPRPYAPPSSAHPRRRGRQRR